MRLEVALRHAGDQYRLRPQSPKGVRSSDHLVDRLGPVASEIVQLVVVRRADVGGGYHPLPDEFWHPWSYEEPASNVTEDRVATVDRVRVALLDQCNRFEDHFTDIRLALVTRQHRIAGAQHAPLVEPANHLCQIV